MKNQKRNGRGNSNNTQSLTRTNTAGSDTITLARKKYDTEQLERDAMGEGKGTDVLERNLDQMIEVLHGRLGSLKKIVSLKMLECHDDLDPNTTKCYTKDLKLNDDDGDVQNSHGKKTYSKDNLVSSDGVFIDPIRLVIKTKQATEKSKALEISLDELFGSNLKDLRGKRSKSNLKEKSLKSEQLKSEAKKALRLKYEKILQSNMESYMTRSIMDNDLAYHAPIDWSKESHWPISIKWPENDQRSNNPENIDGVMDPHVLLQYAITRIVLPFGESMFRWILRQNCMINYFVAIFWLVKIKFFQNESDWNDEAYLLRVLSIHYSKFIEIIGTKAKAEHEKDQVFRFLPYILCSAIHYSFYYLCPGSRHIYTKGLRKTILLQIVQILHGIQLCPITVKMNWAKLFPEDLIEGDDEHDIETFPLQVAFSSTRKLSTIEANGFVAPIQLATTDIFDQNLRTRATGILADSDSPTNRPRTLTNDNLEQSRPSTADINHMEFSNNSVKFSHTISSDTSRPPTAPKLFGQAPLSRTLLRPNPERPKALKGIAPRQHVERMDIQEMSPLVQQYLLAELPCGKGQPQHINRTIPISWCVAGGSDTYRKLSHNQELNDDLSAKALVLEKSYRRISHQFHANKLKTLKQIDKTCHTLLRSGPTSLSRFNMDLMKRHRGKNAAKDSGVMSTDDGALDIRRYENENNEDDIDAFLDSLY